MSFGKKWCTKKFEAKFPYDQNEEAVYMDLMELYTEEKDKKHQIKAFYPNTKGRFGKTYTVQIEGEAKDRLVNFPKHLTEVIDEMMVDEETIQYINEGTAYFIVRTYYSSEYDKTCASVEWLD